MNNKSKFEGWKITIEAGGFEATWKSNFQDLDATELLEAVKGLFIAHTFVESTVIKAMKEVVENYEELQKTKD